jgi:hypothetical protein
MAYNTADVVYHSVVTRRAEARLQNKVGAVSFVALLGSTGVEATSRIVCVMSRSSNLPSACVTRMVKKPKDPRMSEIVSSSGEAALCTRIAPLPRRIGCFHPGHELKTIPP